MKKTVQSKRALFLLLLLIAAGCKKNNPPSETLNEYIDRPEIEEVLSELYFYPTTVRMLDKFIGEGAILEGVKEGRLFYSQSDSMDILNRDWSFLRDGLELEGFELLAEFRSGDMNTVAYLRDMDVDRYVVLVAGNNATTLLIEMKGEVSLQTLKGLSTLNSANVMSLLDLTKAERTQEPVSPLKNEINEASEDSTTNSSTTLKNEI